MLHVVIGGVEILLAGGEQSQVGPTGGLAGSKLSGEAEFFLRAHIVAALQSSDPNGERAYRITIGLRLGVGQPGMAASAAQKSSGNTRGDPERLHYFCSKARIFS